MRPRTLLKMLPKFAVPVPLLLRNMPSSSTRGPTKS